MWRASKCKEHPPCCPELNDGGVSTGGMSVGSPFRILRVAAKVLFVRRISCKSNSIHQFWHDILWSHEGLICPVAANVVRLNLALSSNITCKHVEDDLNIDYNLQIHNLNVFWHALHPRQSFTVS